MNFGGLLFWKDVVDWVFGCSSCDFLGYFKDCNNIRIDSIMVERNINNVKMEWCRLKK